MATVTITPTVQFSGSNNYVGQNSGGTYTCEISFSVNKSVKDLTLSFSGTITKYIYGNCVFYARLKQGDSILETKTFKTYNASQSVASTTIDPVMFSNKIESGKIYTILLYVTIGSDKKYAYLHFRSGTSAFSLTGESSGNTVNIWGVKGSENVAKSFALSTSYRRSTVSSSLGYKFILASRFGSSDNHVGKGNTEGVTDYNSAMYPLPIAEFATEKVTFSMQVMRYFSDSLANTFHWAITTSGNGSSYEGAYYGGSASAVTDPNLIASGTLEIHAANNGGKYNESYTFDAVIPANTQAYIYFWCTATTYGNFHILGGKATAVMQSSDFGGYGWNEYVPYIYDGTDWVEYSFDIF